MHVWGFYDIRTSNCLAVHVLVDYSKPLYEAAGFRFVDTAFPLKRLEMAPVVQWEQGTPSVAIFRRACRSRGMSGRHWCSARSLERWTRGGFVSHVQQLDGAFGLNRDVGALYKPGTEHEEPRRFVARAGKKSSASSQEMQ